jgi:ribonucleoside-triphosphate reductase (formate)
MTQAPSARSAIVTRRTYNRPLNDEGTVFETWPQTVNRSIQHQAWLWHRADPKANIHAELEELEQLMLDRKVCLSGRTMWLGGTDVAKRREASQFNCSFLHDETVYDMVDTLWLLLQGCGVGFRPIIGQLTGFSKPIPKLTIIRSERTSKGGKEENTETWDPETGKWTIQVGDSAESWAKSIGKLLAGKHPAKELVIDFSQLRPAGERLKGYGWISSGDGPISQAYTAIFDIMNKKAGCLLTRMDVLDVVNWLGTILSSRRSAQIALFNYGEDEWEEFVLAKREYWKNNPQRAQSNNSLLFKSKPSRGELEHIFDLMQKAGGSEPGFINAEAATRRAPWFKGVNPCAEILLGNKSFCNLVEVDLGKFHGDTAGLHRAVALAARANYRQTCVNLQDGVLQEAWDLNNAFLRLCGVGLTGVVRRPDLRAHDFVSLERTATAAAYGMADELGLPRPKNVTCIKPSGTLSKVMDTTEGVHKPLGKYIFNNVQFGIHDPAVATLREAGYEVKKHPFASDSVLVKIPVKWDDVPFEEVNGTPVNLESAVSQLNRYKFMMDSWCHHNVSCTISYDPSEVPQIIDWLMENWDSYVGVSFLYRADPTKTAADLGYPYLPQEVVNQETWEAYASTLKPINLDSASSLEELVADECARGACPIR